MLVKFFLNHPEEFSGADRDKVKVISSVNVGNKDTTGRLLSFSTSETSLGGGLSLGKGSILVSILIPSLSG